VHGLTRPGFTQDIAYLLHPEQLARAGSLLDFVSGCADSGSPSSSDCHPAGSTWEPGVDAARRPAQPWINRAGVHRGEGDVLYAPKIECSQGRDRRRWQLSPAVTSRTGRFGIEYRRDGSRRPYISTGLFGRSSGLWHPRRALRGPFPPGSRGPGRGIPSRRACAYLERWSPCCGEVSARGRHQRRPHAEEDPHGAAAEGAFMLIAGTTSGQGRGVVRYATVAENGVP